MTVEMTTEQRFWAYVDVSGECWVWMGARIRKNSYGRWCPGRQNRLAHRWVYERENGPIPPGWEVCHHCDNPPCVRPDHLFLGTKSDNMRDAVRKGRMRRDGEYSPRTKLTWEDVRTIRSVFGWIPTRVIAERFELSQDQVRSIASGKSWVEAA